jgi:hypothetical protein
MSLSTSHATESRTCLRSSMTSAVVAIREVLLPKLMSGEARVNEVTRGRHGVGAW